MMQIILDQKEIQEALIVYIGQQGINLANTNTQVSFFAGRGEQGHKATIEITPATAPVKNEPVAEPVTKIEKMEPVTKTETTESVSDNPRLFAKKA